MQNPKHPNFFSGYVSGRWVAGPLPLNFHQGRFFKEIQSVMLRAFGNGHNEMSSQLCQGVRMEPIIFPCGTRINRSIWGTLIFCSLQRWQRKETMGFFYQWLITHFPRNMFTNPGITRTIRN